MEHKSCHCHDDHTDFQPVPTPCDLRVEYKSNPLGMDETAPRFSYQLFGVVAQTARQLQLFEEGARKPLWDTGWIKDSSSQQIIYGGAPLEPFTRYEWRVRIKDENGDISQWNPDKAFFETGFLGTPWKNSYWMLSRGGICSDQPPQLFFRDFTLPAKKKLLKARLYATALGSYKAELNGTVVSWPMAPGWTSYQKRTQYQAYDVTELITKKNTLWLTLGSGWYAGRIAGLWNGGIPQYGQHIFIRAELHLTFTDGTSSVIGTGEEFSAIDCGGPIRFSDIYDGELYEAWRTHDVAKSLGTLCKAGVPMECQPKVEITWNSGAPVARLQVLDPVKITRRCPGTYIVDFGQNFAGREILHLKNTVKGATIIVKHGEMLNSDGSLYTANLRSAKAITTYVCDNAKTADYEPSFTFYGFRYLEISGWTGALTKANVQAVVLSSDLRRTGLFTCDNPLINRLFENVGWGLRSNFLDVPTDCPQRDERFGWTGDTQVFCNAATYCVNAPEFYTKWITDLNLDQTPEGDYPHVCPTPTPNNPPAPPAPAWTDAAVIVPWQLYRKYGDKRILEKYFDQMYRFIQREIELTNGTYIQEPQSYGDWLNIDAPTSKPFIGTAYMAGSTALLAKIAGILGRKKEAKRLNTQVKAITEAFQKRFFHPKKGLLETTQTAYLLALQFNLLPKEWIKKTVDRLVKDIKVTRKLHLSTGFVGTPLLLPVLTRFGHADLAYELLNQTTYPGWLYPVTQGATTMWERWNSYTKESGFGDINMNSFNHYAYGAVAEWFFETITGIQPIDDDPAAAAFKRFRLAPIPGKTLNSAFAAFCSPYGVISSTWERLQEDGKNRLVWNFAVPDNTVAEITLPPGKLLNFTGACEFQHDDNGNILAQPGEYTLLFE